VVICECGICTLQVAEWTKQISVKWRELTAEQKETFQKMAANDKQRYVQQVVKPLLPCRSLKELQHLFITVYA